MVNEARLHVLVPCIDAALVESMQVDLDAVFRQLIFRFLVIDIETE